MMDEDMTVREDLGYRLNTKSNVLSYPKIRDRTLKDTGGAEKSAVCRARFLKGEFTGDVKRIAWEFAEPLLKRGQIEFIEWVR
jgi:hypothetical protein